jgi:hypothetical protein
VADDAGALLVRAGLIPDHALAAARGSQRQAGGTLGEHLVAAGAVSDEALTEFYRSRLMVPQVSPTTLAKVPPAVIAILPRDMAVEHRVMPVSLDRDGNLTVAMSDPSDRHAVDEIGFFTGKYVVRAVATQMQLAWCLAHYYDYVTELAERLMQPAPAPAPAAPAAPAAAPAVPTPTRTKGDTARVDAARHRVLVPVTTPPPIAARPGPEVLVRPPPAGPSAGAPAAAPSEVVDELSGPTIELVSDEPDDDGPFAPERPLAPRPAGFTEADAALAAAANANREVPADPFAVGATVVATLEPFAAATVVVSPEATRPQRVRPAAPDPPELAARSGEVERIIRDGRVDAPAITIEINLGDDPELEAAVIELDRPRPAAPPPVLVVEDGAASAPAPIEDRDDLAVIHDAGPTDAVIHDSLLDDESAPVLLEHFRRGESPPAAAPAVPTETIDEPSGPVVLLERKKGVAPRRDKRTVLGVGILPPIPRSTQPPPAGPRAPEIAVAISPAALAAAASDEAIPLEVSDEEAATRRVEVEPRTLSVDDGWSGDTIEQFGPPGTTIPPPFLGVAGPIDDPPSGRIPLATGDADSARLELPAAAPPPRATRTAPPPPDPAVLARQLEEASAALVELLRGLDHAATRDHVIAMMVDFVASSHHRVAFLVAKAGELSPFMQVPAPLPGAAPAKLDLTQPSTFQDVIGTRLPYRGPLSDGPSRALVKAIFGSPTDDMLAVPVAVRDRVVGVIYADGRYRHSYDEHVTVGGRAAGLALERILKDKRAHPA